MHGLGILWLFWKFFYAINFILYRVAAWTGALYYYRQGKRTGQKRYYLLAILIYLLSWILVFLFSSGIWHYLRIKFHPTLIGMLYFSEDFAG